MPDSASLILRQVINLGPDFVPPDFELRPDAPPVNPGAERSLLFFGAEGHFSLPFPSPPLFFYSFTHPHPVVFYK